MKFHFKPVVLLCGSEGTSTAVVVAWDHRGGCGVLLLLLLWFTHCSRACGTTDDAAAAAATCYWPIHACLA